MLDYLSTQNALHTRGIEFTLQEYMFAVQVAFMEDKCVAYASVFDTANFKRNVPSEDEEDYLNTFRREAEIMLDKQHIKHLREYIEQELQSYVQDAASRLEDYKFTGADVQKLLSNLLHNRTEDLDEASIRDILSLIKGMYDSGALDSGDAFERHFITVHDPFNALCVNCNREFEAHAGIDCVCPHCHQVYKWTEQEKRFYPKFETL